MAGNSLDNKKNKEKEGLPQTSPRGNMDEYEAVRTIVSTNPGLLTRVLEKIRTQRSSKQGENKSLSNKPDSSSKK
jgi:hypothetical protein